MEGSTSYGGTIGEQVCDGSARGRAHKLRSTQASLPSFFSPGVSVPPGRRPSRTLDTRLTLTLSAKQLSLATHRVYPAWYSTAPQLL